MFDSYLLRKLLSLIGCKIIYSCEWGSFDCLYSTEDYMMCRPCHPDMSVAPPWSIATIAKLESKSCQTNHN